MAIICCAEGAEKFSSGARLDFELFTVLELGMMAGTELGLAFLLFTGILSGPAFNSTVLLIAALSSVYL